MKWKEDEAFDEWLADLNNTLADRMLPMGEANTLDGKGSFPCCRRWVYSSSASYTIPHVVVVVVVAGRCGGKVPGSKTIRRPITSFFPSFDG